MNSSLLKNKKKENTFLLPSHSTRREHKQKLLLCGKQSLLKQYVQTMAIYYTVRDSTEYITRFIMDGKVVVCLNLSAICTNNAIKGETVHCCLP